MEKALQWFPKRFSPGDMDASGGDRMLGKTELSRLAVVVRETAQNSWDARLAGGRPHFGVSLRRTSFRYREDLASLFGEGGLDVMGSLKKQANLRVLEISDRGTSGLDGPADLSPVGKGRSARFQDLILKFGVPHNNGSTGGTYGFGKTAAYAYSGIGTVVYWTRCVNPEGEVEDRFIVSAFRDSYETKGIQYTGRHWWGIVDEEEDSVLPVVGEEAARLGARFFERGFEDGETGTSLLILDPLIADEEDSEDASEEPLDRFATAPDDMERDFTRRARHAFRANLWPKMVPAPGEDLPSMRLELRVGGEEIDLGGAEDGALSLWGSCLNAIRSAREGSDAVVRSPYGVPIKVEEVSRYRKTIGHLAIVQRFPDAERSVDGDDLDPSLPDSRVLRIALMRGQAELVVTTVDWVGREPNVGEEWLAVYKSADAFDQEYAESEPPAHDSWVTEGSSSESSKIIRHTKTRVKRIITDLVHPRPAEVEVEPTRIALSTGSLSRRLGTMLPVQVPTEASSGAGRAGAGRRRGPAGPRWGMDVEAPRLVGTDAEGRQMQEVRFTVSGPGEVARVKLSVSLLGDEGLHEAVPPEELEAEWTEASRSGHDSAEAAVGRSAAVRFVGAPRRALRIELTAGAVDGRS